jgi:hypothetical protein
VTLGGRVLDALSGVAVLEGAFDDAVPAAIAFDADGHFSVTSALALDGSADGEHTLTLSAVDARGNFSAPVSLRFTLDTRAPEIVLRSLAEDDALSTASRLTGTADPTGSTLVSLSYAFDGGRTIPVAFDPASGEFDSVLDLAALAVGGHTLTLTARDAAGHTAVSTLNLTLPELIPLTITRTTPSDGADDVGATFRPQVVFSRPVDVTTLTSSTFYATDTTGAKLAATIVPAADGSFAWLFLTNPLPGASTITLHVVGDGILAGDGQALDADGDGTPGGTFTSRFTTVSVTPIAGTTISGRLLDPGDDLKPMTFDDIRAGADGALHTADDVFLHPIAGAKVFILGLEGNVVYTDAHGYFHLDQVPAGDVKLAIDGRTASNRAGGEFLSRDGDGSDDRGRLRQHRDGQHGHARGDGGQRGSAGGVSAAAADGDPADGERQRDHRGRRRCGVGAESDRRAAGAIEAGSTAGDVDRCRREGDERAARWGSARCRRSWYETCCRRGCCSIPSISRSRRRGGGVRDAAGDHASRMSSRRRRGRS